MAISPKSLDPLLSRLGEAADAGIRKIVINRLADQGAEHTAADVARFLSDENPSLRVLARTRLMAMAGQPESREQATAAITQVLAGQDPLSLEQAALAAGAVNLKSAAGRLLQLLDDPHTPVAVAAATSLRKLQLPDTLGPALAYVTANVDKKIPSPRHDATSQLIQLMGILKYAPAEPVLLKLIPKDSGMSMDRQAAIWTLGLLHEGQPDASLVRQLTSRAKDGQGMNPEDGQVRIMSVVAIGLMKNKGSLGQLQNWIHDEMDTTLAPAARWAVGQITGERPPEPDPVASRVTGWFLEPLDR
jgi:HEAT repeat protein